VTHLTKFSFCQLAQEPNFISYGWAEALVAGEHDSLETMVNIRENHWVAIAFNFEQSLIWYRDSWGQKPVDEVTSILDWWMFYNGEACAYSLCLLTQI
jgi:hypothetical protein